MCGRHVGVLRDGFCVFAVIITIAYHARLKSLVSYTFLFLRLSIRYRSCIFHPYCLLLIFPLLHFQRPRCCSQPASRLVYAYTAYGFTDRPIAWGHRSKSLGLHARILIRKNVIIFATTTPIDIKPNTCRAQGRHASARKISPSYDAAFRRR